MEKEDGMPIKKMLGLGALILLCASPALAQHRFELQPFVGYKWGGSLHLAPNIQTIGEVNFKSSVNYGFSATYYGLPNWGLEFMWNRQPTKAVGTLNNGTTFPKQISLNLDEYHGNVLITLADDDKKFKPFILAGMGATIGSGAGNSTTKFSFGVGGGIKYFFSEHLGVRTQMRWSPTYMYSTSGDVYCDWWGFCWTVSDQHYLHQFDVTTGLIFRF